MRVQKLNVSAVLVGDRYREKLGDLTELMRSMAHEGQLQPIVVLDNHELLFGERRLEAARTLGWQTIDVIRATSVAEAAEAVRNDPSAGQPGQLPLKPSERVSMIEPLYALRQREIARGEHRSRRGTGERREAGNEMGSLCAHAIGMDRKLYSGLRFALHISQGKRLRGSPKPVSDPERRLAREAIGRLDAGATTDSVIPTLRLQLGYLPMKHTPSLPFDPRRTSLTPARPRSPLMPQVQVAASKLLLAGDRLRRKLDDDRWPEQRSNVPTSIAIGLRDLHDWLSKEIAQLPSPDLKE